MRKKEARILIVDDDDDILFSARVWLKKFFTEVITLTSPNKIQSILKDLAIDVIILDMNFRRGFEDGKEGLYWLTEIHEHYPEIPIILMTAYGEVELAVDALKNGASDFILKPWNNEKLYASVQLAVDLSRKNKKLAQWENLQKQTTVYQMQTASSKMQNVLKTLNKVAITDANVLLLGENGTGKYVMAEYLHQQSLRKKEPFVHIDLGSLSENLFESELFGYAKGAFTDAKNEKAGKIENADGGTVFLDEIGNLSLPLQQKLLTLLQTKKLSRIGETKERYPNVRFVMATNAELHKMVTNGTFREDLYFRINTVEVELPPLRERPEDLETLCQFFIEKYEKKYNKSEISIVNTEELKDYPFPGNIRELEHAIERAIILSDHSSIHLQLKINTSEEKILSLNLEEMEEKMIKNALKKYVGNISAAAEALGLSRAALYRRMEKFGI